MPKSFYQNVSIKFLAAIAGVMTLGGLFGAINDARELVSNFTIAIWATTVFLLCGIIAYLFLKYCKPEWGSGPGPLPRVIRFGESIYWGLGGMLTLIWTGALLNAASVVDRPATATTSQNVTADTAVTFTRPLFDRNDKRFRILILPWVQQCMYQQKQYTIGQLLKERFDVLNRQESLNLSVAYMGDSEELKYITPQMADSLMKYHNADHVFYGAYSFRECEGTSTDKISFNYRTNYKSWALTTIHGETDNQMVDFHGQRDLREGSGYEPVDYMLRWGTSLGEMKAKHFTSAIKQLHMIPGLENRAEMLFQLGNCYYSIKDFKNARISNEKAFKADSSLTEAAIHIGVALAGEHQYDAAVKRLETVLKKEPMNDEALRNLGNLYKALGDTAAANNCFDKQLFAIKLNTEHDMAAAGMIYHDKGEYSKAVFYYDKSLRLHANHPERWAWLGLSYNELKDTVSAVYCFERALSMDSSSQTAWYQLGMIAFYKKELQKAQQYLDRAVQLDPFDDKGLAMLGLNSFRLGMSEKAKSYLQKAYDIEPLAYTTLYWSFAVYNDLKEYAKAKQYMEVLVKRYPSQTKFWNELGLVNGRLDKYEEAITCFRKILQLSPDSGTVYYSLASISSCQRKKKNALNYLSRAILLDTAMKKLVDTDKSFDWMRHSEEFLAVLNK